MTQPDRIVDATGLHCPQPVILCKAALSRMGPGETLCLLATDRPSVTRLPALIQHLGDEIVAIDSDQSGHRITIKRHGRRIRGRALRARDTMAALLTRLFPVARPAAQSC